jgi:hypothetical protein
MFSTFTAFCCLCTSSAMPLSGPRPGRFESASCNIENWGFKTIGKPVSVNVAPYTASAYTPSLRSG